MSGAESNEAVESLRVTRLASGGEGIGRLSDGRVVFVEDALPGDRVELSGLTLRKNFGRARVGSLLEASPDRVEPHCTHFGVCGGCRWQHLRYGAQLEAKRGFLSDALERIGGQDLPAEIEIVASPEPYAYRARARLVESEGRVGYRRRGSRQVEAIDVCPVLLPTLQTALDEIGSAVEVQAAERTAGPAQKVTRRERATIEWILTAGASGPAIANPVERRTMRPGTGRSVEIDVLGEKLRVSAASFLQANALLWDVLAQTVRDQCLAPGLEVPPKRFIELYAGTGFLTLPLARLGVSGVAIESERPAVADLERNLASGGLADRVEVIAGLVERRCDFRRQFSEADLLLADPPRAGLQPKVRDAIAAHGPRRFVYVSCDPATLARDLRMLTGSGYELKSVRALDLFPQTPHVEAVATLERG